MNIPGATTAFSRKFVGARDHGAWYAALRYLHKRGFAVGPMQAHAPTGVMFGNFAVSKW